MIMIIFSLAVLFVFVVIPGLLEVWYAHEGYKERMELLRRLDSKGLVDDYNGRIK